MPAKIIVRDDRRVYFRKRCPTHGVREDFICSDARFYDRMEFSLPGKVPPHMGVEPEKGCPFDCGLCTEHEQHTCVGLVEITSSCNLSCPMCYAHSGPGGSHLAFEECTAAHRPARSRSRAVPRSCSFPAASRPSIPSFLRMLEYGCSQPIDIVMINTNGIRFAHDAEFVRRVAEHKHRVEIYFQFDGFSDDVYRALRGEPLSGYQAAGPRRSWARPACAPRWSPRSSPASMNARSAPIVRFGLERPWITGISFQPATYSGRFVLPEELEQRITFPDVVRAIAAQTDGLFRESDFMPLPCAHPNCHTLTYAYRSPRGVTPLSRFIDAENHLDILANGITFTRPRARQLIEQYLDKLGCCAGAIATRATRLRACRRFKSAQAHAAGSLAEEFFTRALAEQLSPADVFRITITSFLDAYNFDVRRLMKCCIHHVLPSGHVIPFCAYNVLYRDGHVALPQLRDAIIAALR